MKFFRPLLVMLVCAPIFAQSPPWQGILSSQRAADWTQAGVQGSAPGVLPSATWTQCGSTIAAGASAATINAAIQACGTNQYVQLGAGDFNGLSQINFGTKNNVALRGMGPDQTRLHFTSASSCGGPAGLICANGYQLSSIYSGHNSPCQWSSGYAQGSTQITISSGCTVPMPSVGNVIVLDQCDTGLSGYTPNGQYTASTGTCLNGSAVDNGNYFNCELEGGMSGNGSPSSGCSKEGTDGNGAINRFQSESHMVTAVNGNTITLAEPLLNANWTSGQYPEAWWYPVLSKIGVENLYIDASPISSYTYTVFFLNTANSWAYGIEAYNSYGASVGFDEGAHHELANSYFYEDRYPDDQATQSTMDSYDLYINNIYQQNEDAILFEGVSSGTVVAYNWFAQACNYQASGAVCRSDAQNAGYRSHSNGNNFALFEGNYGPGYMDDDDHGAGLSNTVFRNFFTGWEPCGTSNGSLSPNGPCGTAGARASQTNAIILPVYARYNNIVANVLGTPGFHTHVFDTSTSNIYPNTYVYLMGSGEGFGGSVDALVQSTTATLGNWDVATNGVESAGTASSAPVYPGLSSPLTTYPASFFLTAKPSWWPSSAAYPAIGPDVSGGNVGQVSGTFNNAGTFSGSPALMGAGQWGNAVVSAWGGHVNLTPAGLCYVNGGGTPDGTGPAITFSPSSCYPSSGQTPAATPTFSPVGGSYSSAQSVTISDSTSGATIYYTTNGSTPTTSSSVYSSPINVSASETLKAIATASGHTQSAVGSASYTIGGGSGGSLSGTVTSGATAVTISSGTSSWAFFNGYNHNASGTASVSNVTVIGGTDSTYANDPRLVSWTGGTPTSSSTSNPNGVFMAGIGNGFSFTVPASTTAQTVNVYVGGWQSGGTLTATLSDNSATPYSNTSLSSTTGQYDGVYTLTYAAASAGQTLTIAWKQASGSGNVTIQAASINGAPATLPNGTYTITNVNSGLVMDVYQASTTPGTLIDQYTSNSQSNQRWQVTAFGGGLYTLVAVNSSLCLDVLGQSVSNGGSIDEYTCNGGTNQQFTISQVPGHTYYTIIGKQSGLAVEVPGSSITPGTFLDRWTSRGGANQEWTFQ